MSKPAGYFPGTGNPYWLDQNGNRIKEDPDPYNEKQPSPETGMTTSGVTPAPAKPVDTSTPISRSIESQIQGNGSGSSGDVDSMIDEILGLAINTQYPMRQAGFMNALSMNTALANGSPMEIGKQIAPEMSGLQSNIQSTLAANSRRLGPSGGGLLKLGRQAGLLPIQKKAAALPGKAAQAGRDTLLEMATGTSILTPQRGRMSSGRRTDLTEDNDYSGMLGGFNALGSGLGRLFGADMGNGQTLGDKTWDWLFGPTPMGPIPTASWMGATPSMTSTAPVSIGGGFYT